MMVAPKNACGYGSAAYATFQTTLRQYNCGGGSGFLTLSPNPADVEVSINLKNVFAANKAKSADVYLFSNTNELVFNTQLEEETLLIPTHNLEDGLYHLKVITEGKKFQKHLVIKH